MTPRRYARWLLGIAFALLCAWLLLSLRNAPLADGKPAISDRSAPSETEDPLPANPRDDRAPTREHGPRKKVPNASMRSSVPSAECFAARAREAREVRPTEVELEAAAQQRDAEHEKITAAFVACSELDGDAFDDCLVSRGVDRGSQSADEIRGTLQLQTVLRAEAFRIAARGDARSLVAAALVMPEPSTAHNADGQREGSPETVRWLVQAQRLGRNDALVQWSVARAALFEAGKEPPELVAARDAARARLPELEPDNAAAFLFALARGGSLRAGLSRTALARAAAMPRYRVPMAGQVALMLEALRGIPSYPGLRPQAMRMNPDHEAAAACASDADLLRELRMLAAIGPAVDSDIHAEGLAEACSELSVERDFETRDDCLSLLELVYAAGSLIEQAHAAALARRIAPAGTERARWEERHRVYLWRQFRMMGALEGVDPYELSRIFEQAWRSGNENLAIDELLTRANIPLEPPPDWQPPIGH